MKTIRKKMILAAILIYVGINYNPIMAQSTPPDLPGDHGTDENNTPVGGGAPIGGGLFILSTMAAAYAYGKSKFNLK